MNLLIILSTLGYAFVVAGVCTGIAYAVMCYQHKPKLLRRRLSELLTAEKAEQERLARGPQFVVRQNSEIADVLHKAMRDRERFSGWIEHGGYSKIFDPPQK